MRKRTTRARSARAVRGTTPPSVLVALLAGLLLALVAGCELPEEDSEEIAADPDDEEGEASEPDPDVEQVLTVGAGDDGFDSPTTRPRLAMYPLNTNTCETLVRMDENFEIQPMLATDWEYVGENTFRFELREDVTFHNGEPLTAEAVKYSFERLVEKEIDFTAFLGEDSIEVIDDHTVEVTPAEPNLRLVEQIVHPTYSIIAPGTEPEDDDVVCTGPFEFVEYVPDEHLQVQRYDDYWDDAPELEEIDFRFIPDDETRRLALEAGEVDVIFDVPRPQVSEIEARDDMQLAVADPGAVTVARINVQGSETHNLLTETAVRRALGFSIDRQAFVDMWDGHAEIVPTVNPPSALGEHADLVEGFTHDPERAEELLEDAGWTEGDDGIRERDGERLSLDLPFSEGDEVQVLEIMQAHARDVGIEINLEPLPEGASMVDLAADGELDIVVFTPNQNDANPSFLLTLQWWNRSNVPWTTYQHPDIPEFDDRVAESLEVPDLEESRRLAAEAQHVLIDQEGAAIPLVGIHRIYAMVPDVQGFEPHPSRLNQAWWTVYRGS